MANRDIAIIGYGETKIELRSGRHTYDLGGEAFAKALAKAGIDKSEIDGLAVSSCFSEAGNPFHGPSFAEFLGLDLNWCQVSDLGGASASGNIARAAAAINAGLCETVVVVAADAQSSTNRQNIESWRWEWMYPVGVMGPVGTFGLLSQRYDEVYGLNPKALAKLAVTQRNHAILNDNACEKLRKPITEGDYMKSPMISSPIRMLDCVMVCDGASAFIVTSTKRAKELGARKMVHPIGYGEKVNHGGREAQPDILEAGHFIAGPKALKKAGMEAKDIQSFHPYDDFLIAIVMQLEQIGFCKVGQGCDYVLEHDFSFTGDLPLNTGGGQISAGQAGLAGGAHNLSEALRQLFGDGGKRQVKRTENAMVTGIGWIPYAKNWGSSTVLILEAA